MAGSRGSSPAPGGLSLGAKFVGLTAGLILLLSLTAFISLRTSASTVAQIKTIVDFAIPAYGALARSHIRSLEQAVEMRRALLLAEDPTAPDHAIVARIDAFRTARMGFEREFADAGRLLEDELANTSSAGAAADLRRLREELAGLRTLTEAYTAETDAALAAIRAQSLPQARQHLVTIDDLRNRLGDRLEALRAGMFALLQAISKEAQATQAQAQAATIGVFVLSSLLGLGVAAIGAVRLIRSIRSIVHGAEAVEGGDLDTRIEIASRDEIGRLAASFNRMTEGLRMRDWIRDTFGKYVDRRIAEQLIASRSLAAERGDRREVAVMFCDLAAFSALSEQVEAEKLVQFLNACFTVLAREIAATDGIIDKYIGDAVMAYWCPPFVPQAEVAQRSVDAAVRCLGRVPALGAVSREIFAALIYEPRLRIGIASGQSITGSIGAEERRNYTVIGDTVNLASRIERATRLYRTTNLVCGRTAAALRATFALREVDRVLFPGIEEPQAIFEVIGRAGQIPAEAEALCAAYERALTAYRRGDWAAARRDFSECLGIAPADGPTRTMLERIATLPAPAATAGTWDGGTWDGIWRLKKEHLL